MKQTLEAAAIQEAAMNNSNNVYGGKMYSSKMMIKMFKAGAIWQSNQMAWINVNYKMPEDGIEVDEKTIFAHTKDVIVLYKNGCVGKGNVFIWMIRKGGNGLVSKAKILPIGCIILINE